MFRTLWSYRPTPERRETVLQHETATKFEQQAERAGLLCTDQLNKAKDRCRSKVKAIAKQCRAQNRRFRDIEFDIEEDRERCLHGLSTPIARRFSPADVMRAHQIFDKPKFYIEGAKSSDIMQGRIGDCWFLSALATVSTMDGLIEEVCVEVGTFHFPLLALKLSQRDEQVGVYGFIFYRDSGWVDVIVDDLLYTSVPKFEQLSRPERNLYHNDREKFNTGARKGGPSLYFAKSGTENETWVPLIEKAYAKLHGDYAAIDGGLAADAIEDLTGGVSTIFHVHDILDEDMFWEDELMKVKEDRLFGCYIYKMPNTPNGEEEEMTVNGLFAGHAYSVIAAIQVNGKRFLRIRNPWGKTEWTGAWSDGSKEWTREWLERLSELGHSFGNDGEFIMEYKDFLSTWTMIERSRLFDKEWKMSSMWLNVNSRSFPCAWNFGDVSFTFSVTEDTPAVIVLSQLDDRYFAEISGYSQWTLEFVGDYVVHVRLDRRHIRNRNFFQESIATWDHRKLSKVWSEACLASSIAVNFDPRTYGDLLPTSVETYAGRNLTEIEQAHHELTQKKNPTTNLVVTYEEPDTLSLKRGTTNSFGHDEEDNFVDAKSDKSQEEGCLDPAICVPNPRPRAQSAMMVVHHGRKCDSCSVGVVEAWELQVLRAKITISARHAWRKESIRRTLCCAFAIRSMRTNSMTRGRLQPSRVSYGMEEWLRGTGRAKNAFICTINILNIDNFLGEPWMPSSPISPIKLRVVKFRSKRPWHAHITYFDDLVVAPEIEIGNERKATTFRFEQQSERAGLLCTEELRLATERCHQKVEAIIQDCRARNCRFRDIEFDLEGDRTRCLYGLNVPEVHPSKPPSDVLRATQIFQKPQFFIDGASSSDVAQGSLGDCWFVSAISVVSTMQDLVSRICVHRDEEVGVYGFIFYRDSGWVDVIIDDLLYTKLPKYEELTPEQQDMYHQDKDEFDSKARMGGKTLYFARSKTENETWVPLLEKAYAKLHGDYASLDGGYESEAIEDLTGGVSTIFHVKDILSPDRFWDEQLCNVNKDRLFGCFIDDKRDLVNGLHTGHAYSVLEALEVAGKRFVRLRNPWGESEWTGPWSDGSKEWTPEWLLRLPELHHTFGQDGEFLMEYTDFLKNWTIIERSRLFDSGWKMSNMWLNVNSRTFPSAWGFGDVSFTISVTESTPAVIVLSQLDDRYYREISGYSKWSLDFVIYRKGAPADRPLARSPHSLFWRRSVNIELNCLEVGEYVIHVRLDRDHIRSKHYIQDMSYDWNQRKLSKVWTESCVSKSIAANFDPKSCREHLPAPAELFGGEDLNSLEIKYYDIDASRAKSTNNIMASPLALIPDNSKTNGAKSNSYSEISSISSSDSESNKEENRSRSRSSSKSRKSTGLTRRFQTADDGVLKSNTTKPTKTTAFTTRTRSYTRQSTYRPTGTSHFGTKCNECKVSPIVGDWYRCLDSSCLEYSVCSKCMSTSAHDTAHRMVFIRTPEDAEKLENQIPYGEDNSVTLGLRVYTKGNSVATIAGQLRHGNLVRWRRKDEV
ncbi:hypothetical protein CTheo_6472 [Ceratobasidium theobromae]|uniref:Calpain catalytic domain-containing protein n=1 Tax=Ceratobasidium theobromae TaxID=1582974 RepID=A0A5N5QEA0_9AGAM|nr:hypothetical protein CTheo_6472 [Ceratobasidium theobromae]